MSNTFTNKYGTLTAEGFIPHLPHKGIFLPVMLDINNNKSWPVTKHQPPLRINDHLCFALPGGSIFQSKLSEAES